jgi:hypothetical protein
MQALRKGSPNTGKHFRITLCSSTEGNSGHTWKAEKAGQSRVIVPATLLRIADYWDVCHVRGLIRRIWF